MPEITALPEPLRPPRPRPGDVVLARPWNRGEQYPHALLGLVLHRGVVGDEALGIWYPALGAPQLGPPAHSVQALWPPEVDTVAGLADAPPDWVTAAAQAAAATHTRGGFDIGPVRLALQTAARRHATPARAVLDVVVTAGGALNHALAALCSELRIAAVVSDSLDVTRHWWSDARLVLVDEPTATEVPARALSARPGIVVVCQGDPPASIWAAALAIHADHVVSLPDGAEWLYRHLNTTG